MRVELTVYLDEGGYEQAGRKVEYVEECSACGARTVNKRPTFKEIDNALGHAINILFPKKEN